MHIPGGVKDDNSINSSDEAAAAKLWAVYISEAEKYDKALVESWKADMEGMLIFAGLFSASLTAFIIESYKTLIPDSADPTVQLLAQISQQLAASANGSVFHVSPPTTQFTPPVTSLVCNALWFISLGLSLSCALVATLLEQWARDFLHKSDIQSAPVIRARIFSYLYYGLKRFNMHTVVEIIPLLLHASLLCFFGGLIAFLIPINFAITVLVTALLALVAAVYTTITLLPLWFLDCPYRTPLTGTFWSVSRSFVTSWRRQAAPPLRSESPMESMVEIMSRRAVQISPERSARDYRALVWTVKSLADDTELEPFFEAIPDTLWSPRGRRHHLYTTHIQSLMRDPDLQLLSRLDALLRSCDSGLLSPDVAKRRKINCYKALWAIASLQTRRKLRTIGMYLTTMRFFPQAHRPLSFSQFRLTHESHGADVDHFSTSAVALTQWSTFSSVRSELGDVLQDLAEFNVEPRISRTYNLESIISRLRSLDADLPISMVDLLDYLQERAKDTLPHPEVIPRLTRAITDFRATTPHIILFDFLRRSATLESPPFQFYVTQDFIECDPHAPFSGIKNDLERALEAVVYNLSVVRPNDTSWTAAVVVELLYHWRPDQAREPTPIPRSVIDFLNLQNSDNPEIWRRNDPRSLRGGVVNSILVHLLSAFPVTLSHGLSGQPFSDAALPSLWRLASLGNNFGGTKSMIPIYQSVLEAVVEMGPSPMTVSVIAMIKVATIASLVALVPLAHQLLPTETALPLSHGTDDDEVPDGHPKSSEHLPKNRINRIKEAKVALLSEFVQDLSLDSLPYKASETISHIGATTPRAGIHKSHQIRLAQGIRRLSDNAELFYAIINTKIFDVYARTSPISPLGRSPYSWLEDATARAQIKDTLSGYLGRSSSDTLSPVFTRIKAILQGFDSLHTAADKIDIRSASNHPFTR